MSGKFDVTAHRQNLQTERNLAESILGNTYTVRVYSSRGRIARGTVMLADKHSFCVHTAYIVGSCEFSGASAVGTAIGIMIDRNCGKLSVVLADEGAADYPWSQHEIAEAVDYWEAENDLRILCLYERSCGAVVYTGEGDDRRYLVIRMNLGHCGLPKGHIEKYETEEETALREVREETGVEITLVEGFRKAVQYSLTPRTKKESVYFLGHFEGDTVKIQEAEVSSYRLCSYADARRLITYENDRAVLDAAEKLLSERHT